MIDDPKQRQDQSEEQTIEDQGSLGGQASQDAGDMGDTGFSETDLNQENDTTDDMTNEE